MARISDVPAVSQCMSFMEGGFPLAKAEALITRDDRDEGSWLHGPGRS